MREKEDDPRGLLEEENTSVFFEHGKFFLQHASTTSARAVSPRRCRPHLPGPSKSWVWDRLGKEAGLVNATERPLA